MKVKKKQSYITILDWMVEKYHLKGNELIAYALIYGFSQDGESEYKGSYGYLCKWLGVDRATAIRILKRLESKGLLTKRQTLADGKVVNKWIADLPEASPAGPEIEPEKETAQHPPDRWQNATGGKTPPVAKCDSDRWQNATPPSGKTPPRYPIGKTIGKSIYQRGALKTDGLMDSETVVDETRERFREQLELDDLAPRYDPAALENLLSLIVEMYTCPNELQYIGKMPQLSASIRKLLDRLTGRHIEYIMDNMARTTTTVKNIRAYLQATILRAATTLEFYEMTKTSGLCAQQPQHPAGPNAEKMSATLRRIQKRGDGA